MLRYSLVMEQVILPDHPQDWPTPLDLQVGLKEVLLLDGVTLAEGESLLRVAATLKLPQEGTVLHWGKSFLLLPRGEVFRLRRHLALITPGQVLLQRFSLGENIALSLCYHHGSLVSQVLQRHRRLLDLLELGPYLALYPPQLPPDAYLRGLIARELVKGPELILATPEGPAWSEDSKLFFREALLDYIDNEQTAIFLAGRHLGIFQPLGHRLLQVEHGRFSETLLLDRPDRSPAAFLRLV